MKDKQTVTLYSSQASELGDKSTGVKAWIFSLPDRSVLLCAENEVSIRLDSKEQLIHRTLGAWRMVLIARGMLSPAAENLACILTKMQEQAAHTIPLKEEPKALEVKKTETSKKQHHETQTS